MSLSWIPSTIPEDECRKLYECEKHAQDCPSYKEFIEGTVDGHTGTTSSEKQSAAAQAAVKALQQLAVCVEKFDADPLKGIIKNKGDVSKYQQAAFLLSTLWAPQETLRIAFMGPLPATYPGDQPQWDGTVKRPPTTRQPPAQGESNRQSCGSTVDCVKAMGGAYACAGGVCVEDLMPLWYTKDQVMMNMHPDSTITPEEEAFEAKVRTLDPIDGIKAVVTELLQPLMGLKMVFTEDASEAEIRIALDNRKGAWSMVGQQSKTVPKEEPTMNFGWLDVATIVHEFCHALGMIHEHQNPFGKGIDWNLKNVFAWANNTQGWDMYTTCQNITKRYKMDLVNGSDYDPKSIMLYSYPAFLTNDKQATYRNVKLSESDKEWLSAIYPPDGKARTFPNRAKKAAAAGNGSGDQPKWYSSKKMVVGAVVLSAGALGLAYYMYRGRRGGRRKK